MNAFTVIGVLVFWMFCWELGYLLAMLCDAKARWDEFMKPVTNELSVLISAMSAATPQEEQGR